MEKAPYQPQSTIGTPVDQAVETRARQVEAVASDWRHQLPIMIGRGVTLRELRRSDVLTIGVLDFLKRERHS